jgi:hypothetical protein
LNNVSCKKNCSKGKISKLRNIAQTLEIFIKEKNIYFVHEVRKTT